MRIGKRVFLRQAVEPRTRRAVERALVLLLFDRKDVARALDAGKQVLAVIGIQELAERLDAADHEKQIILAAEREHGVDQIMPRALLAQLDLHAVGEEGEEIGGKFREIPFDRQSGN